MSLSWPVKGTITQQFGSNPNSIQPNGHTGVDFGIPEGTPIYAADSGNIVFEGWATTLSSSNPWWIAPAYAGILIIINHNDGFMSVYGHLSGTVINNGQFVEKGQLIGHSGSTGLATGPHLHFEVFQWPLQPYNGFYGRVNPNPLISGFAMEAQSSLVLAPNQRSVGENNINQRAQPNTTSEIVRIIQANTVETFTGYVRGENFSGSDLWYKDDQGYAWAKAFASPAVTDGLPDLTPPPPAPALSPTQRKVGADNVNQRTEANTSSPVIRVIAANTVEEFTGYVIGESVQGLNVWFKDKDGYAWAGGFIDQSTNGLPNLTPAKPAPVPVQPPVTTLPVIQRQIGDSKLNVRSEPNTSASIVSTVEAKATLTIDSWVTGQDIEGISTWFKNSSGYMWAGGFTTQDTNGLSYLGTIKPPAEPEKYSFAPAFDFVEVIPAGIGNFEYGNFPGKPEKVVIHQFGTPGVDTLTSTINTFNNPNGGRQVSAHFVVSGKRIIQMVSLKDRAYHAGSVGNNYVGIETDPAQDADTIASTKRLLQALKDYYGYELVKTRHRDVPGNSTNCGSLINLDLYNLSAPVTPPVTETPIEVPQTQPSVITPEIERQIIEKFFKRQLDSYFTSK
jgi:hypothetical protein